MKKIMLLLLLVVSLSIVACADVSNDSIEMDDKVDFSSSEPLLDEGHAHVDLATFPLEELSQEEIDGLLLMREEEKLARDVYNALYNIWGQRTFMNIAQSEHTHTMEVKDLLDRYELEDPVGNNAPGVFVSEELQVIYDDFVEQGSESLIDALIIGAMVEDLDIHDLETLIMQADNQDIIYTYENLMKGSENHIRSFTKQLDKSGEEYVPVYISQARYDLILSTPHTGSGLKSDGTHDE